MRFCIDLEVRIHLHARTSTSNAARELEGLALRNRDARWNGTTHALRQRVHVPATLNLGGNFRGEFVNWFKRARRGGLIDNVTGFCASTVLLKNAKHTSSSNDVTQSPIVLLFIINGRGCQASTGGAFSDHHLSIRQAAHLHHSHRHKFRNHIRCSVI